MVDCPECGNELFCMPYLKGVGINPELWCLNCGWWVDLESIKKEIERRKNISKRGYE